MIYKVVRCPECGSYPADCVCGNLDVDAYGQRKAKRAQAMAAISMVKAAKIKLPFQMVAGGSRVTICNDSDLVVVVEGGRSLSTDELRHAFTCIIQKFCGATKPEGSGE